MTDKEKFLKSVCIVCDTREQQNGHITAAFDKLKVNHVSVKLPYGDYSFKVGEYDFSLLYAVERKGCVDELWGNCTKDRERFEREIKRMSAITGNATLIIENCKSREYLRAYQIPDWQMKAENRKVQSVGRIVDDTLQAWGSPCRYGLQVHYVEQQKDTANLLLSLFYHYFQNFKELMKVGA